MMAYIGEAQASGAVARNVKCEKCATPYHYFLLRTVSASVTSGFESIAGEGAAGWAQYGVTRGLETGTEIAPCPKCGWVQAEMIKETRRRFGWWAKWLAGILLGGAGLIWVWLIVLPACIADFTIDPEVGRFWKGLSGALVAGAVGIVVVRVLMLQRVDPNRGYPQWPRAVPGSVEGYPGRAPTRMVSPR
jgi:hypothetical protein